MKEVFIFIFGVIFTVFCYNEDKNMAYIKIDAEKILKDEFPNYAIIHHLGSEKLSGPDWYIVVDSSYKKAWKIGFVPNGRDLIPL